MRVLIGNNYRKVFITKKKITKNTYIKVKEDLNIYVTCNTKTKDKDIVKLLNSRKDSITKMYYDMRKRNEYNNTNYFLGEKFEIVSTNLNTYYTNCTLYLNKDDTVEDFYKREAKKLFLERINYYHKEFSYELPKIKLRIRKMKTRWGVCNTKTKTITLNLNLIKKQIKALDYVIVHELAHLIYADHSKSFWRVVSINYPNYKMVRKYLNSYEEDIC